MRGLVWAWVVGVTALGSGPFPSRGGDAMAQSLRQESRSEVDYGKLDFLAGVERQVLDNGMTVLVKSDRRLPIVSIVTGYRVGSVHEPEGTSGLAHFLEHMLFKGTDRYGKGEIDRLTIRAGGSNNAYTENDFTQYWFTVSSDTLDQFLQIEASRMRHSLLDQKEFDQERNVVTEELYRLLDSPWGKLHYEIDQAVFKSHSYRRPGWGFEEDLKTVKHATMRDFYQRYYGPNNATMVIVGDVDRAKTFARVRELFGSIPKVEEAAPPTEPEPPQKAENRLEIKTDKAFDRLALAFRAGRVGSDEDFTLDVIQQLLSHGKDSRLYRRLIVRDRTATSVEAMNNARRYDGVFYVFAEVSEERQPAEAEAAILEELEQLKSKPVAPRELQKAKNILTASFIFAKETYQSLADEIAAREALGAPQYLREYLGRINAVTAEQIQAVARGVFRKENRTVARALAKRERRARSAGDGPASAEFGEYHEYRLPNGLTLLVKPRPGLPIVTVDAYVHAGTLTEPAEKAGVAALTGRLLDQGFVTPDGRTKTAEQIAEEVEFTGARLTTSSEGIAIKALTRDLPLAYDFLRDMLLHASFPKDKVELYRQHQLEEIQAVGDSPSDLVYEMMMKEIYAGHPLERPANGRTETVSKLTREDIVAHHRAYYRPDNTIIAVAGDVTPEAVAKDLRARFADWTAPATKIPRPPAPSRQSKPKLVSEYRATNQVNVCFGHLSVPSAHPDFYALRVFEYIFCRSTGFVDRLSRIVREEMHLAYEVWGTATQLAEYPAPFLVYIGTGAQNGDRARAAAMKILEELLREGPKEEELETAKDYLIRNVPFAWDSTDGLARYMVTTRRLRLGIDWPLRYAQGIAAVGKEDVIRAARTHLSPEALTTIIVGPVDKDGKVIEDAGNK